MHPGRGSSSNFWLEVETVLTGGKEVLWYPLKHEVGIFLTTGILQINLEDPNLQCCTENTPITMSQLMHSSAENGSPNLLGREGKN